MKPINRWSYLISLLLVFSLLTACQKFEELEESAPVESTNLTVSTRSISSVEVPYPVWVYAFSEGGSCVAKQQIASETEGLKMELPVGKYQLIALAGVSTEYLIPDMPTLIDAITMVDGVAKEAAMIGRVHVTLTSKPASLEIVLNYAVAAFKASLAGIPTTTTQLSIHLSPLYGSLLLGGDYATGGESTEILCRHEGDGVWSCDTYYIYPGSGQKMAFSISLQEAGGAMKSYGYQTATLPQANHPYIIHGSYLDGSLQVEGGLVAEGWGNPIYVEFDFGPNISPEDGSDLDSSEIPAVGSIWNDCIVVDVSEERASGATLILLSMDEWEIYRTEISNSLAGYSVNGISGWRVPTYDEAGWLNQTIRGEMVEKINSAIDARKRGEYLINAEERYLCDKAGVIYSFAFAAGKNRAITGDGRTYLFRAVTEYRLTLN